VTHRKKYITYTFRPNNRIGRAVPCLKMSGSPYRAPAKEMLRFQRLLTHISPSPQYAALPPPSPHGATIRERCSPSTAFPDMFLRVPRKKPPFRFPLHSPYVEKDTPPPEPSLWIFQGPQKRNSLLQVPLTEPLLRRRYYISTALFTYLSKSTEKDPLPPSPTPRPGSRLRAP
jgi:hypothetical protein